MTPNSRVPASFRDPSGFVYRQGERLLRQVNREYQSHYDRLLESGLSNYLEENQMMVRGSETTAEPFLPALAYRVIEPEIVPFLSYPYEWSFTQLKDAALLTLAIQKTALKFGMTLKDASAYNIQFLRGRPILIDTLSFEIYQEGKPWEGYRQFCQHFLAPLALMSSRDPSMIRLLQVYLDGIPLDLASRLLPFQTRFNFGLLAHLHLHAGAQKKYADQAVDIPRTNPILSATAHLALIENLEATVQKLNWKPAGSEWADYYESTNYSESSFAAKIETVKGVLERIHPNLVLDLGANTGIFSRIAAQIAPQVLACDVDPGAVELNYLEVKKNHETNLLPFILDLTNPAPAIGWENQEREALFERVKPDTIMALALIHHLAISNNLPLDRLAQFFSRTRRWLIIEFIPKEDTQVKRLLQSRRDIFPDYHVEGFEAAFASFFDICQKTALDQSPRILYLMEKRSAQTPQGE